MSRPFDCPCAAPDARVVLAWVAALIVAWAVLPRVPWLRLYRWAESVEFAAPPFAVGCARWLLAAFCRVRAVLDPAGERWREMGRYLAALPPRSGLTPYEEWVEEARALPPGPARAAVRAELRRLRPPSAAAVAAARRAAGRPVVEPRVLAALLAGREPSAWRYRRELSERRRLARAA